MKVALVDAVRLLDQSQLGLAGAKRLEELFHSQQRELAPLIAQAQKTKRPAENQKLEELARGQEQERERLRAELRDALLAKARTVIEKLAPAAGVDFVMAQPQVLLWVKPELDLTEQVLAALDKEAK
jgi:Skp family chaperone for outer membrane proteins